MDTTFVKDYNELMAGPPPPPMATVDLTKRCFDDWFKDGYTKKTLDLGLNQSGVPKYWDSKEYATFVAQQGPLPPESATSTVASTSQDVAESTKVTEPLDSGVPVVPAADGGESALGSKYEVLPPISQERC